MSIRTTTVSYAGPLDFISSNTWFDAYLERKIRDDVLESSRLKSRIREVAADEMPGLMTRHITGSAQWGTLMDKINEEAASAKVRVNAHVSSGIAQINSAVDTQVNNLVNGGGMEAVRTAIDLSATRHFTETSRQLNERVSQLERKNRELETKIKNNEFSTSVTAAGVCAVGLAAILLARL